jgi:hypothetical protein
LDDVEPGGFLQWDEIDYDALCQMNQENPRLFEIMRTIAKALNDANYSTSAQELVGAMFKRSQLIKVTCHDYTSHAKSYSGRDLQDLLLRALQMLVRWALVTSEKDGNVEAAHLAANQTIDEMKDLFAAGLVPCSTISIVIGQK